MYQEVQLQPYGAVSIDSVKNITSLVYDGRMPDDRHFETWCEHSTRDEYTFFLALAMSKAR